MAEKKAAPVTTVKSEVDTMIDALVEKAQVALQEFLKLDQEQVDHIVHEMALAGWISTRNWRAWPWRKRAAAYMKTK